MVIDVQKPPSSHKSAVYYTTRIHNHFHLNCSRSHLKSDLLHPLRLILSLVVHLSKFLQNFSNLNPPPPNHIYGEGDREQVTMAAKFPPLKNDILLRAARGTLFFSVKHTCPLNRTQMVGFRRRDRTGSRMGYATGREISSRRVSSVTTI
jgi:hypothetical protein